jgi:hypothetical protein
VIPLPGLGLAWSADGDLVAGLTVGGPIPGPLPPPPPPVKRVGPPPKPDPEAPPMSVPITPPPPLGDSLQLVLFDLHGGVRARDDYAIGSRLAPRAAGAPLALVGNRELLVVEPHRGDPLLRLTLPERAGLAFTTVVDGAPTIGVVLADPLGFLTVPAPDAPHR